MRTTIATLEAQRALVGDAIVNAAVEPLRRQLILLEAQLRPTTIEERRLLTILFADVVGSTALAEKMDPEEWHRIITRLHAAMSESIARRGGSVSQFLGDGLLALFGVGQPSESDPENAIRAALEIQNAGFRILQSEFVLQNAELQLRIGIHTGLVVIGAVGTDAHREFTATGDAMNLSAHLQSAAPPGAILISHDTYRYVRGLFNLTPQPPLTVKGKSAPIQTYLVTSARERPFRIVSRGVAGIETRTIGREREAEQVQTVYLDAFQNRRRIWVQLTGDPGVGKSRLVEDFEDWMDLRPESIRYLRGRGLTGEANQPFALVRRMWFARFGIPEDAPLAQAQAQWEKAFRELTGTDDLQSAQALGLLVGLPFRGSPYLSDLRGEPMLLRAHAVAASRALLAALRRANFTVLLLEDLHWVDTASWEYLMEALEPGTTFSESAPAEQDPLNGLLVVATARLEWNPPAAQRSALHAIHIALSPLDARASDELAHELLKQVEGAPEEQVQSIVARAEGVPYFIEELVNLLIDRGVVDTSTEPWRYVPQPVEAAQLPQTLQHLLLTRLLALPLPQRIALQYGSIFGRRFWEGGLAAMGLQDIPDLLAPLQPRGLVAPAPTSFFRDEREWHFRHALLHDVTYESVLRRERPQLHRVVARWLEKQAREAGRLDEFAGQIAEHAERAGDAGAAGEWYLRAGEFARASSAPVEARRFMDRALELLPTADHERRWRALLGREGVLELLGEREAQRQDIEALLQLAEGLGEDARRAEAHFRHAGYLATIGDYRAVIAAANATIAAARRAGNIALEVWALGLKTDALAYLEE
ncbi:MAG: adenylate/guanylate cyclase domain-containing protein [Anaerolineae bacterium]